MTLALRQAGNNHEARKSCVLHPRSFQELTTQAQFILNCLFPHLKPKRTSSIFGVACKEGNAPRNGPYWIKCRSSYRSGLEHNWSSHIGKVLVTKDCAGSYYLIMTTIHSQDIALGNTDAPSVKETWFNWFFFSLDFSIGNINSTLFSSNESLHEKYCWWGISKLYPPYPIQFNSTSIYWMSPKCQAQ